MSLPCCWESVVRVGRVRRSTLARLRRIGIAIKRFFGTFEPTDAFEPGGSRKAVAAPRCVWYGRAVFCMHYPEVQLLPEVDHDRMAPARRQTQCDHAEPFGRTWSNEARLAPATGSLPGHPATPASIE